MSQSGIQAIAAVASAIAAIASTAVAIAGWKVQRMVLHSEVMPDLRPSYKFDDSHIELENIGKGVALNLCLQKSQQHYLDTKEIVIFDLSSDSPRTIYPHEKVRISIIPKRKKKQIYESKTDMRFELFQFVNGIGRHRQLGLIYSDVFGRRMSLKVKFTDSYKIESFGIRPYGVIKAILDSLDAIRFRSLRRIREWLYEFKASKRKSQ